MTRLLYVSGDPELAKRLLRLYVQVVSKAREASLAEADDAQEGPFGVGGDYDNELPQVQSALGLWTPPVNDAISQIFPGDDIESDDIFRH